MKLIESDGTKFVFHLDRREHRLLGQLLTLYPLIPETHHRPPQSGAEMSGDQELLQEALAEQRRENRREVEKLLNEEGRFKKVKNGFHLTLSAEHMDWLLQVVNDIRVGSWVLLGEPDEKRGRDIVLTEQNAPYLWSLELSGHFQSVLLRALNGEL